MDDCYLRFFQCRRESATAIHVLCKMDGRGAGGGGGASKKAYNGGLGAHSVLIAGIPPKVEFWCFLPLLFLLLFAEICIKSRQT